MLATSLPQFLTVGAALLCVLSNYASAAPVEAAAIPKHKEDYHWVDTWTSMQQIVEPGNLPPAPFVRLPSPHFPSLRRL